MAAPYKTDQLSLKEERFVELYVRTGNAQQSTISAGYSVKNSGCQAQKLLNRPCVRAAIDKKKQQWRPTFNGITPEEVLEECAALAFVDPMEIFDGLGNIKPVTEWPARVRRAIQYVEVVLKNAHGGDGITDTVLRVRFHDKPRVLDLIARHLGMLVERKEIGRPGEFAALSDQELALRIHRASARLAQLPAAEGGESGSIEAEFTLPEQPESAQPADSKDFRRNGPG